MSIMVSMDTFVKSLVARVANPVTTHAWNLSSAQAVIGSLVVQMLLPLFAPCSKQLRQLDVDGNIFRDGDLISHDTNISPYGQILWHA